MTHFRYVGLMVAAAACLVLGASSSAEAQYNAGGSVAPDGMWFAGGINASNSFDDDDFRDFRLDGPDGAGIRIEFGIPLTLVGPGQLGLVLPISTVHENLPGDWRFNSVTFAPEIQWEYVFPIRMRHRFSLSPQAGFGFGGVWFGGNDVGDDGSFMILWKTGVNLRFGFDFGLILQVQPLGFTFNIPTDSDFDFYAAYEFYTGVGYRWD